MTEGRLSEHTLTELKRPFAPNAIKFKIASQWPKDAPRNGLIVSFVDARTVHARLNYVVQGDWSTRYEHWGTETNLAVCYLTIQGVTRCDVGKGAGLDKEKACFSDAIKRAAVGFGVGQYLYALQAITLKATESGEMQGEMPTLRIKSGGKQTLSMTPQTDERLRRGYANWLASDRNIWGEALDHGDEPDALGDPVEREVIEQEDLELAAEREAVQKLYEDKIAKANGKRSRFPKGTFNAQLKSADSPEKLKELRTKIEEAAA